MAWSRVLRYEMNELMKKNKDIVQFILGYIFYRVSQMFTGDPTLFVLDEAWLFLDSEYFQKALQDYFKTLRKKNVYIIIATQEAQDAKKSAIFSTIVNACFSRIYLPNEYAMQPDNLALYKELGLDESDATILKEAQGGREYFYASKKGKQKFELCLSQYQLSVLKSYVGGAVWKRFFLS